MGGRPIRTPKRSAEWCLKGVDQCWFQKAPPMRPPEREVVHRAYDFARNRYKQILAESDANKRQRIPELSPTFCNPRNKKTPSL
jgi:hypothetical protein